MRSIKLLAALAIPAMFAACTQEEAFKVDNTPQQMEEVVGTKLIGTDVSLNATKGSEFTRLTTGGTWEAKDLIGLGWITKTGPSSDQSKTELPDLDKLYANHMFSWDGSEFTTKGNIYEGWYFAYYPWTYERKVVDNKIFQVNPAQTSKVANDRTSQGLHISNLQFVSVDDLDFVTNSLKSPFQLYSAVGYLRVQTSPSGAFVDGKDLAGLDIQSVTINAGDKDIFANSLKLMASKIAPYDTLKNDSANMVAVLKDEVLAPQKADGTAGRDNVVTTDVSKAGYLVSDEKAGLITIAVPCTETLVKEDISIEVAVNSGKFVIKYVNDAVAGTDAAVNNAAIERLVKEYAAKGLMTQAGNLVNLPVKLYGDIFVTDFDHISNIEEWNDAVKLVNALGRAKETFKIDSTIVFTDTIPMPTTCKLTVERATTGDENRFRESLTLAGGKFYGWPETLTSKVYLTIAEDATVYDAHEIANQTAIINKGTIVVPDGAKDAVKTIGEGTSYTLTNEGTIKLGKYAKAQRVDNSKGRIEVIYGSYVAIKDNNEKFEGEIAYVVMPADTLKPVRIQNVINTAGNTSGEYALANILIFDAENGIETFDFTKPISGTDGEEDPYNSTPGTDASNLDFKGLDGVSIEINNVDVTSTTKAVTVKSVKMTGADAKLTNVNVVEDLTVENGGVVETTTIGGNVETDGDVTAETIEGNVTVNGATIEATTIEGDVTATDATIKAETIDGKVTIVSGTNAVEGADVAGNVAVQAGTATLTDINIAGTLENKGTTTVEGKDAAIADIVNYGTLNANTNITVATISHEYGCLTNVQTTSETEYKTIWYTVENGSKEKVGSTRKGEVKYLGGEVILANLKAAIANGGDVTLVADVTIDAPLAIAADKEVNLNLNGNTLTWDNNSGASGYALRNLGKLTLSNGTIVGDGANFAPCLYTEGEAVLNNCTLISENSNAIKMDKASKLTINGGYYESKNPTGQALRVGNWQSGYAYAWDLTINGGEFIGTWAGLYIVNNYVGLGDNIGKAVIKNASFKGDVTVEDSGVKGSDIVFDKVKNVTIEGCTLQTSTIHSETTEESVINKVSVKKIEDVYNELFQ